MKTTIELHCLGKSLVVWHVLVGKRRVDDGPAYSIFDAAVAAISSARTQRLGYRPTRQKVIPVSVLH